MNPLFLQELERNRRPDDEKIWELFHENSKIGFYSYKAPSDRRVALTMKRKEEAFPYHGYPTIKLESVENWESKKLASDLLSRRSALSFKNQELTLKELSILLKYGYGITFESSAPEKPNLRAIPSAGALYPLDLYFYVAHVKGLQKGLYYYNTVHHHLSLLKPGNFRSEIEAINANPRIVEGASVIFFITAFFERSTFKYDNRGYRFSLIEAGHLAQNLNLIATDLGLGVLNIGGFYDRRADDFLSIDGLRQSTLYMTNVGGLAGS